MGHKVLEELNPTTIKISDNLDHLTQIATTEDNRIITTPNTLKLFLNVSGVKASAIQTDEGIVVLEDSELVKKSFGSLSIGYRNLKNQLISDGTLMSKGEKYVFQKKHLFDSPSAAAAIIVGHSISGPQTWKDINGLTLKEIEDNKIA